MATIKLATYVAQTLVDHGIEQAFMITGGGAMHLNDAFGRNPGLKILFNHHEQACSIGAEGYARVAGKPALVSVTTGPGGTNAITGVLGAWQDGVPMVVISGQVRYDTTVRGSGTNVRQLGDQEVDIVKLVESITKYSAVVSDASEIRFHLEKALYLTRSGRPGPVWLDIPMNIQAAMIDPATLKGFEPAPSFDKPALVSQSAARSILNRIKEAKRPVIMVGTAVRTSGALEEFRKLVEQLQVPVVTAFNAHDTLEEEHPLYCGRPGTVGDRPGNFAVQNSDLLIVLGCRLNIRQVSYFWQSFAREAYKVIVDIDPEELKKPTIKPDIPVCADVADFIGALRRELGKDNVCASAEWLNWCRDRKKRYPVVQKAYWDRKDLINPYCFIDSLSDELASDDVVVTGNGAACVCTFQALRIKRGQRLFSNSGCASMGYDLPVAMGAVTGRGNKRVVCIAGDGSIQMNIQELQTVVHNQLPVKIFLVNNNGYHSIRQTQENFFGKPLIGCDAESGVSFPDMEKLSQAYGLPYVRCRTHAEMKKAIRTALDAKGPFLCEVMETQDQPFAPKTSSYRKPDGRIVSRPLEDLAPFLEREEFMKNMIIAPIQE